MDFLFLLIAGAFAGFIDSIAGGGGLITLPTLTIVAGPGAHAIGTNKIVGTTAAFVALLVYARAGHVRWKRGLAFAPFVALGSLGGSFVAPLIPVGYFKLFLAVTCPLILWVVLRRDLWIARELATSTSSGDRGAQWAAGLRLSAVGLLCGFYDGLWGPGGGTFMFLALLFVARLPLLEALGASKLANTASALISLGGYASQGYVHWKEGLIMACAIGPAAFLGATHATRNASRIVRPALAIVAILLVLKLLAQPG